MSIHDDPINMATNDVFKRILNRNATPQELSRYRGLAGILPSIVESIRFEEEEIKKKKLAEGIAIESPKHSGVSIISTYNSQCGIATYAENLYKHLISAGFKSNVISDTTRNRSELSTEHGVVKCWSTTSNQYDSIFENVAKFGNRVVHIQHEFGLFQDNDRLMNLICNLKRFNYKVAITLHTVRNEKMFDAYYRSANVIIVHGELAASRLYSNGINNVTVIRHGTEEPLVIDPVEATKFVSQFIGLKPGDILATSAGFISVNKMQIEATKAMIGAQAKIPNLKFLIIGSTSRSSFDSEYVHKLKNLQNDRIIVIDKFLDIKEMAMVLTASSFAVSNYQPTHHSTSGMCHLLISYRVPSISSNSRILDDLHPNISSKVDCYDVNGFEREIIRLCDPSVRSQMKNNLKDEYLSTSWKNTAIKHISVYNSIMA